MKKIVLPAIAATLATGAAVGAAMHAPTVALNPSAPPMASSASVAYQQNVRRTGFIHIVDIFARLNKAPIDSSTFDK